jgi:glycosyltransferase involved in cell wall biosynthesis
MISILLPTFNGEKYLSLAIESVLNQTFKDFELLIAFNGTIDNSKEIPSKYNDSRIKVFDYGDDKGKSRTLNKLLNEAKFDWIALQDDDDIWVNNKLEKQIDYINKGWDVIGTFINYINEEGQITGRPNLCSYTDDIKHLSLSGMNQVANTSTVFKKEVALEIGGWAEGIDGIEDYDFWLRLLRGDKKFTNIPEELVHHRLHSNSNFNTKKYDLNKVL